MTQLQFSKHLPSQNDKFYLGTCLKVICTYIWTKNVNCFLLTCLYQGLHDHNFWMKNNNKYKHLLLLYLQTDVLISFGYEQVSQRNVYIFSPHINKMAGYHITLILSQCLGESHHSVVVIQFAVVKVWLFLKKLFAFNFLLLFESPKEG